MRPIILSSGMPRSGSTAVFNLVRSMASLTVGTDALRSGFANADETDPWLADAQAGKVLLIKAHIPGPATRTAAREGRIACLCTWRDPRDAVASAVAFMKAPFHYARSVIEDSLRFMEDDARPHGLVLPYDSIRHLSAPTVEAIAEHVGAALAPGTAARLAERFSFDAVARTLREEITYDMEVPGLGHRIDSVTQWHEGHLQSGEHGRWHGVLSAEEVLSIEESWMGAYCRPPTA